MKTITIGTKWHEKVKNIRKLLIRTDLTCYCDTVVVVLLHLQKKTESFYLFLEKKHLVEISRQGNLDWSLGQKKQTKNHQLIFLCVSFSLNICCCFSFCFFLSTPLVQFATCMSALGQGASACMSPKSGSKVSCVFSRTTRASGRSTADLKNK